MEMDYLTLILVLLNGGIGYWYGVRRTISKFQNGELYIEYDEDEYIDEDNQIIVNDILAYLEVHDNIIYMYKLKDNTYLSHGTSIESLQDKLLDRFPNKTFAIALDDEEGIL
jgi:hypothetical protein